MFRIIHTDTNFIKTICRGCRDVKSIDMNKCGSYDDVVQKIAAWRAGSLIQRVFPELNADERELMISGTCGECWNIMFAEEEEDKEEDKEEDDFEDDYELEDDGEDDEEDDFYDDKKTDLTDDE